LTELKSEFIIRESVGIDKIDLETVPISNLYTEFVDKKTKKSAKNILIDDNSALKTEGVGHILKFDLKDITYQIFAIGLKSGFDIDSGKQQIVQVGLDKLQTTKNNELEYLPLSTSVTTDSLFMTLQGNTVNFENNVKRIVLYGYPVKIFDPNKK